MSEVEKMYENTIGKVCTHTIINPERCNKRRMTRCCGCDYYAYPLFTAEKQLNLIKWLTKLGKYESIELRYHDEEFLINTVILSKATNVVRYITTGMGTTFEVALADLVNSIWKDLTEEERKQIKEVLE